MALKTRRKTKKSSAEEASVSSETLILEAYLALAQQKGVAGLTLQEIADRAGVAFGTVRYHFNQEGRDITQEALLYLIKKAYIFIDEKLFTERGRDGFNPIHAYVRAMFEWVKSSRAEGSLLVYYYYLCTTQAKVAIPNSVFLERARLRIESLIHEAIGRKLYAPIESPADVALKIHLAVLGACIIAGTARVDAVYDEQMRLCLEIVESSLKAVKPTV